MKALQMEAKRIRVAQEKFHSMGGNQLITNFLSEAKKEHRNDSLLIDLYQQIRIAFKDCYFAPKRGCWWYAEDFCFQLHNLENLTFDVALGMRATAIEDLHHFYSDTWLANWGRTPA